MASGLGDIEGSAHSGSQVGACASKHKKLDYVAVASAAGDDQRREAVAVCLVDGGVGGEQQPRAPRVTSLTCTKQAKAEVGRSCHPVDEALGLGLVAATERVDHRVGRHEAASRVHG